MGTCSEKAVWVIVPQGEDGIAVCRAHVGYVLENMLQRKSVDYGFAYIPDGQPPAYACEGAESGKTAKALSGLTVKS
jgi:hypothetical protein